MSGETKLPWKLFIWLPLFAALTLVTAVSSCYLSIPTPPYELQSDEYELKMGRRSEEIQLERDKAEERGDKAEVERLHKQHAALIEEWTQHVKQQRK